MKKLILPVLLAVGLTSCVGTRTTDDQFTTHAEAFNIFGFQIPEDDHAAAWAEVPEGATIETVRSTPSDWTSIYGILNRILGVTTTEISGTTR